MKKHELTNLLVECIYEAQKVIPVKISKINLNVKVGAYKSRLGECSKDWRNNTFQISLSKYLLECDTQLIKEVLLHEIIHTCDGCFNHGKLFQAYVRTINNFYSYNIATIRNNNKQFGEKIQRKYKLTCTKCGTVFYRDRLTQKYREFLKHSIDNGRLLVEQLY